MKQKRFKRMAAVLLLAVFLAGVLTSCSKKLSGTYKPKEGLGDLGALTFKDDEVSITISDNLNVKGTYRIEGGKIYFTYTVLGVDTELEYDYEKKGSSIFIDGVEYEKQK